jgi:hypothetical protein
VNSEEIRKPPRAGRAPLDVRAALAGGPERPRRELARDHPFCRPDGLDHLPPVTRLGLDVPAGAARDVLDVAAGDRAAEGLFEAGGVAGDPEPVGAVDPGFGAVLDRVTANVPSSKTLSTLPRMPRMSDSTARSVWRGLFQAFARQAATHSSRRSRASGGASGRTQMTSCQIRSGSSRSPRCAETCLQTV